MGIGADGHGLARRVGDFYRARNFDIRFEPDIPLHGQTAARHQRGCPPGEAGIEVVDFGVKPFVQPDFPVGAIFFGTETGLPEFQDAEIYPLTAASSQYFGCSSLFEDLDGDGMRDLAVGGWGLVKGSSSTGPHTGGVFVFPGGADWSLGPAYGLFPDLDVEANMGMDMIFFRSGPGSFLAVALEGEHGDEGAYAAVRFNETPVGAPDRAVSFPSNTWEYYNVEKETNYTYFIPVTPEMAGQKVDVVVLGMKGGKRAFKPVVWLTAHPIPLEERKLVLFE